MIDKAHASFRKANAFTIVELLIVIVVIAILAAISIVAYVGIQNRANDTVVQSDLSSIAKKIILYKASADAYPPATTAGLTDALDGIKATRSSYGNGLSNDSQNLLYCVTSDRSRFGIAAWSKSGQGFSVMNGNVQKLNYTAEQLLGITCSTLGAVGSWYYLKEGGSWRSFI